MTQQSITDRLGTEAFWSLLRSQPELVAKEVCAIDLINIEETLQKHSGLRAWVGAAFESCRIQEEQAAWRLAKTRGKVLLEAKGAMDPNTGKAKTVEALKAEVDVHPDVDAAEQEVIVAKGMKGVLKIIYDSLGDRRDMLIQIASRQRAEMGELR